MTTLIEKYKQLATLQAELNSAREEQVKSIGKRLSEARNAKAMTQADAGLACGISTQQVTNIEGGKSGLTIENLMGFCLAYGVTSDHVLGIGGE